MAKNSIPYCRELMDIAELRHLDDAKEGMAVNETEYTLQQICRKQNLFHILSIAM